MILNNLLSGRNLFPKGINSRGFEHYSIIIVLPLKYQTSYTCGGFRGVLMQMRQVEIIRKHHKCYGRGDSIIIHQVKFKDEVIE